MQTLGFNVRVVWRFPGALLNAAGVVSSVVLIAAGVILLALSNKKLANDVLSFQGIPRTWGIVVCSLIVAYGLARANYQEALGLGATNRMDPTRASVVIQHVDQLHLDGSNLALTPEALQALQALRPPETGTEPGPGQ